ncbi:MAG: HAD family hydrolase [Candidatus Eremiobacteraeota bacterium]|nr:HAD family hydrolase [Candidatus Eremiobacteraeota bacterium]
MPRARFGVGFDIDHTLCIDNKLERVAFLHLLERIVADGGSALGSLSEETATIDALLAAQRAGACTIEEAVERFAIARGVTPGPDYAERFKSMAMQMVDAFVVPAPDARSTLDELHRREIPVAILSNGWNPLQIAKGRRAGFRGTVLASGTLGVQKPDAAAFAALVGALGVEAGSCYYVGDDPIADVGGAKDAGLTAVWLDNEGKIYPQNVTAAPITVASLAELLDILPAVSV